MVRFLILFLVLACTEVKLSASVWDFFSYLLFFAEAEEEGEKQETPLVFVVDQEVLEETKSLETLQNEDSFLEEEPQPIALDVQSPFESLLGEEESENSVFHEDPESTLTSDLDFTPQEEDDVEDLNFDLPFEAELPIASLDEKNTAHIKEESSSLMSTLEKRLKIEEGESFINLKDLPQEIEIGPRASLRVELGSREDCKNIFLGQGELIFEKGELCLSQSHAHEGLTSLKQAHLVLNGQLHDVFVSQDSMLSGVGHVHHLTNAGKVAPGNSIGTLHVAGDFIQEETGVLSIELNQRGQSDQVLVLGDALVQGKLEILPEKGAYKAGTRYPFLRANQVLGQFDEVSSAYPGIFTVHYGANFIELFTNLDALFLPIAITNLQGNPKRVADYLYGNAFQATTPDLNQVLQVLNALSPTYFEEGLLKISPIIYGSLPKLDLQNDIRMSQLMTHQFRQICSCRIDQPKLKEKRRLFRRAKGRHYQKKRHRKFCLPDRKEGLWLEPLGFYYHQKQTQGPLENEGQPAFDAYTYGFGMGYSRMMGKRIALNGGLGYTHSNIFWRKGYGNGQLNTLYLAPSIGYFTEKYFINFLFQSSFNFYKIHRQIHISTLKRTARSLFMFYDYLFQLEGGYTFKLNPKWFIRPEGQFNYLYMSSQLFTEKGASSLALKIDKQKVSYFQPNVLVRLIREFWLLKGCLAPNIYVGWLANVPLGEKKVQARFEKEQTNRTRFYVVTYLYTTNQLTLGINVPFQSYHHFTCSGGYEANFLSGYQIHQFNVRIQWDF